MAKNPTAPGIDPPQVIEGFTDTPKLTLGMILLLERIGSPYLGAPSKGVRDCDLLPSVYLYTLTTEQALEAVNGGTLERDAYKWAEGLSRADFTRKVGELDHAIREFYGLLPKGAPGDKVKNPSAATA